jgi:hypothetical protein
VAPAGQGARQLRAGQGGSGNAKYSAYLWLGGLDHMILWKADETNNLCFTVYLNSPEQNSPSFNVTLPMSWGVSNAVVSDNAMDCAPNQPPMGQTFAASSGIHQRDAVDLRSPLGDETPSCKTNDFGPSSRWPARTTGSASGNGTGSW